MLQATGTNTAPSLTFVNYIYTGGYGSIGGFYSTARINSVPDVNTRCFYVSNSGDNTISTVSLDSQSVVSTVSGSATDSGSPDGIGMAVNAHYLYASYTASQTIGVFATSTGCGLTFMQDVSATGLAGGSVVGMAVNANLLVVAYGDGSIQSFNVSSGIPVANNDRQYSSGHAGLAGSIGSAVSNLPAGVDLTADGKIAIFGDVGSPPIVEVSKITNGKLAKTTFYKPAVAGVDAAVVRLSPDQTMLYAVNNESGTVSASFFNATTGAITPGCVSPTLRTFNEHAWFGGVVTRDTTGTGTVLYVAEFGRKLEDLYSVPSAVGILTISVSGKTCTLTESVNSPMLLSFPGMLSIGAYPPRPF